MADQRLRAALRDAVRRDEWRAVLELGERIASAGEVEVATCLAERLLERAREARRMGFRAGVGPERARDLATTRRACTAVAANLSCAAFSAASTDGLRVEAFGLWLRALRLWRPIEWPVWLGEQGWAIELGAAYGQIRVVRLGRCAVHCAGGGRHTGELPPSLARPPLEV